MQLPAEVERDTVLRWPVESGRPETAVSHNVVGVGHRRGRHGGERLGLRGHAWEG